MESLVRIVWHNSKLVVVDWSIPNMADCCHWDIHVDYYFDVEESKELGLKHELDRLESRQAVVPNHRMANSIKNVVDENGKKAILTRDVGVWGKPRSKSCCNWFICFSTDDRTWAMGDSFDGWSWLSISDVPRSKDSTDDNGGGGAGGFGRWTGNADDSVIFEEINVGLERTKSQRKMSTIWYNKTEDFTCVDKFAWCWVR